MRIDKYLKNSRIIKRRTVAKEACEHGRVKLNSKVAKPGDEIKVGDIIEINFSNNSMKVEVTSIIDNIQKDKSQELYKVL